MSKPSKESMEAARAISAGLESAEYPVSGAQVIEIAQRIDAAADAKYARLKQVANVIDEYWSIKAPYQLHPDARLMEQDISIKAALRQALQELEPSEQPDKAVQQSWLQH